MTDTVRSDLYTRNGNSKMDAQPRWKKGERLFFVDNLRALLVTLVIMQHLSITFGGNGDWYIQGHTDDMVAAIGLTLFNVVNEAFFMGFLFMISGYFTPASYDRKGPGQFLKGRLLRLGLPLVFYDLVINPIFIYTFLRVQGELNEPIWGAFVGYLKGFHIGNGPLWFIQRLLVLNIIYVLWRLLARSATGNPRSEGEPPGNKAIVIFAFALALATFILRIWLPARENIQFRGLEFPLFPFQWISLFIIGIIAYRRNWFLRIPDARSKFWLGVIAIAMLVLFPIMFVLGGAAKGQVSQYIGGFRWQALSYAVWQQFVGMGMIICLLVLFRKRVNHHGKLAKAIGSSSYTAYIIHTPVAVFVGLALKDISLYPLLKFALAALLTVPLCFLLANCIRKLPLARRIL